MNSVLLYLPRFIAALFWAAVISLAAAPLAHAQVRQAAPLVMSTTASAYSGVTPKWHNATASVTTTAKNVNNLTSSSPALGGVIYCKVVVNNQDNDTAAKIYWGGPDVTTSNGNELCNGCVQAAFTTSSSEIYLIASGTVTGVRITLGECG